VADADPGRGRTAQLIRIMRATCSTFWNINRHHRRAKGLPERTVVNKYAVRCDQSVDQRQGLQLPNLISGARSWALSVAAHNWPALLHA